jgi:hypothetical protein
VSLSGTGAGAVATFTFTAAAGYVFVDSGAAAVNVNSTNFSGPNSITTSPNAGLGSVDSSPNEDGFGSFNAAVKLSESGPIKDRATIITFTITNNNAGWTTATDVLKNNTTGVGFLAAAHIGVGGVTGGLAVTGFAGNGTTPPPPTPVPEPSSTALAAVGALGFVVFGLRRRLKK